MTTSGSWSVPPRSRSPRRSAWCANWRGSVIGSPSNRPPDHQEGFHSSPQEMNLVVLEPLGPTTRFLLQVRQNDTCPVSRYRVPRPKDGATLSPQTNLQNLAVHQRNRMLRRDPSLRSG